MLTSSSVAAILPTPAETFIKCWVDNFIIRLLWYPNISVLIFDKAVANGASVTIFLIQLRKLNNKQIFAVNN